MLWVLCRVLLENATRNFSTNFDGCEEYEIPITIPDTCLLTDAKMDANSSEPATTAYISSTKTTQQETYITRPKAQSKKEKQAL